MIDIIRKKVIADEIDYGFLMSCLSDYKNPRDKITQLLKSKILIRVKKGLYVFGPDYARGPYSREVLANLIYGPSYISLDYALSFYGMIPERIEVVTSVTDKRKKFFTTPVGNFSYAYLNPTRYHLGFTQIALDDVHNILIATREKALADKIHFAKDINTVTDVIEFLTDDLRIEKISLEKFSLAKIKKLAQSYKSSRVTLLYQALKEIL